MMSMGSKRNRVAAIFLMFCAMLISVVALAGTGDITQKEIANVQAEWGRGVVAIGKAYSDGSDYEAAAEKHLDKLYAYELGPVLFKPTKAAKQQFRLTRDGALSYFIGGNEKFSEDHGFALEPWTKVRFQNAGTFIHGDYAVAMGNYYFTSKDGKEVKVEFSFGYIRDKAGDLKINLHHSSVPYH